MPKVPNEGRKVRMFLTSNLYIISFQTALCIKLHDTCKKIFTAKLVKGKYTLARYYIYPILNI